MADDPSSKIPDGYHEALVTAVAVVITASLGFLFFWTIQPESGCWTRLGAWVTVPLALGILTLFATLHRALSLEDERPFHYSKTVKVFFAGIGILTVAVVLAGVAMSVTPSTPCDNSEQRPEQQASPPQ